MSSSARALGFGPQTVPAGQQVDIWTTIDRLQSSVSQAPPGFQPERLMIPSRYGGTAIIVLGLFDEKGERIGDIDDDAASLFDESAVRTPFSGHRPRLLQGARVCLKVRNNAPDPRIVSAIVFGTVS